MLEIRRQSCVAMLMCVGAALAVAPATHGAITYISSERYVLVTGLPRVDAVAFTNFNQSLEKSTIPSPGFPPQAFRRASQRSQLLFDRMIAENFAETDRPLASGSIAGFSRCDIVFSVDVATQYRLDVGEVFNTTNGGFAVVGLSDFVTDQTIVSFTNAFHQTAQGVLLPGTYRFVVRASADSLSNTFGPARATGVLVLPEPRLIAWSVPAVLASLRRRRR